MIGSEVFCKTCGIVIPKHLLTRKPEGQRFQDGWYCQPCAIKKVKQARG